ncbi:MAG: MBL fold metallo-hydrolase [Planctomycetota bacterium]|nr:MBL fold metallo-hydrolase [Planctomycetota bacterium]
MPTFTLVGSGAVRANPRRGGTCQALRCAGETLVIDQGRGAVQGLKNCGFDLARIDTVFLSHLHFDHVCDLAQLILLSWVYGRTHRLAIYGPPGTREFLEKGVREAYAMDIASRLSHGKDPAGMEWDVTEIAREGAFRSTPQYEAQALFTEHGHLPNINFRFELDGKRIVVTSDTEPSPRLVEFCRGAELLCVECSGTREFLAAREWGAWHMNPQTVAELASKAGVKRVVLKHLVIEDWSEDPEICAKLGAQVRAGFGGEVFVGHDGLALEV